MKFYTRKGDTGKSALLDSKKLIPKNDKVFNALGAVDELNSYLGICKAISKEELIHNILKRTQEDLFIIQAEIGGSKKKITDSELKNLERITDELSDKVGEIHKFVIYGGNISAAHLDYARALARRAERKLIPIKSRLNKPTYAYINRLSSLLFVLARYANMSAHIREENPSY
jgi:ATP:cob(I)alamin adenosyltransferase